MIPRLKFRAWDKQNEKRLYQVQVLQFYGKDDTVDACWTSGVDFSVEPELDNFHNLVLMQYTGMKDINGVEIYEGDIVSNEEDTYVVHFGEFTDTDDFQTPPLRQVGFYIRDVHNDETFPFYSLRYEVVGNVYENKDLLED